MSITSLEILVNGERLYVVGMEGWQMLNASVRGQRFTPETLAHVHDQNGSVPEGVQENGDESLLLHCYVGVPDPEHAGGSQGQNYETRTLVPGDEITVRIVESEHPDPPLPPPNSETDWHLYSGGAGHKKD